MTNIYAARWRDIGDTTLDVYRKEFTRVNSPMLPYVAEIYEAAKPHSALALAQMWIENQYATTGIYITIEMHNPLGLRPRGYPEEHAVKKTPSGSFAVFLSWLDCMNAWKRRHTDTTIHVNGPVKNYVESTTLAEYIYVYAPPHENDTDAYLASMYNHLHTLAELEEQAMPRIIDKWLHVAQDGYPAVERRYHGRYGQKPKIIVLHIQQGNNLGSWQHFHVVSASSTVLIGKNGDIWRLVPEEDSPWTNGDVNNPTALGQEIVRQWGSDPNVYTLSIETEGKSGDPAPESQIASIVWQISAWMTKYNIPLKYVIRHADINTVSRPYCPGNTLYNEVVRRLKNVAPSEPEYAKPDPVEVDGELW